MQQLMAVIAIRILRSLTHRLQKISRSVVLILLIFQQIHPTDLAADRDLPDTQQFLGSKFSPDRAFNWDF
jgi:hypothetical protein